MRNIVEVIDKLGAIDPKIKDALESTRRSCLYLAPELMKSRWNEVAWILNTGFGDHAQKDEISAIFSGAK